MKKITIAPGCITCGLCAFVAPEIFEITDVARVRKDAPVEHHIDQVEQAIMECPVQVIRNDGEYHEKK